VACFQGYSVGVLRLSILSAAAALVFLAACGGSEDSAPPDPATLAQQTTKLLAALRETPAAEGLRVQLAFHAEADLDLYVTDPLEETVYFANTPTRSGGELAADQRCGDTGIRLEEVYFPDPIPGRYRVGVDYPKHCTPREPTVVFAAALTSPGLREERAGTIAFQHFLPTVLEIDLAPNQATRDP